MYSESIVYGCIREWPMQDAAEQAERAAHNLSVLNRLPAAQAWSLLSSEMFSCHLPVDQVTPVTQVIHFAASYRSVEYEWTAWVKQFETLLKQLYWSSAVVHLDTAANGVHTFRWQSESFELLTPEEQLRMRCVWERESSLAF